MSHDATVHVMPYSTLYITYHVGKLYHTLESTRTINFMIMNKFIHASGFDRKVECGFQKESSKGAGASADVAGVDRSMTAGDSVEDDSFDGREVECCGAQPFRKPFKTMNGDRQCCAAANLAFDPSKFTCCESGEIKVACD